MAGMRKDVRARLVAIGTKGAAYRDVSRDTRDASAPDGCRGRLHRQDFARALVPRAAAFLMPPFPAAGDASSRRRRDVAGRRADRRRRPAGCRPARRGRQDRGARPGVRRRVAARLARRHASCLRSTASTGQLRHDTGLAGRDYNGNTSRHGEFVTEIVYDIAPDADYWLVNYHTPDEFDAGRRLPPRRRAPEHRRALELVPVRALRRHGLLRAAGRLARRAGNHLGELGGQLPPEPLGGRRGPTPMATASSTCRATETTSPST